MVVFQERHGSGEIHYHVALLAEDVHRFRFGPVKEALRQVAALESNWSGHGGYSSCVAYGHVPSKKKPLKELDPTPLRWARVGVHPPLAEASVAPVTATAMAQDRETARLRRAEEGKPEARFKAKDIFPVVIAQNFKDDPARTATARESLMNYARRAGGQAMWDFCFDNWDKLTKLITRCWEIEKIEEFLTYHAKPGP